MLRLCSLTLATCFALVSGCSLFAPGALCSDDGDCPNDGERCGLDTGRCALGVGADRDAGGGDLDAGEERDGGGNIDAGVGFDAGAGVDGGADGGGEADGGATDGGNLDGGDGDAGDGGDGDGGDGDAGDGDGGDGDGGDGGDGGVDIDAGHDAGPVFPWRPANFIPEVTGPAYRLSWLSCPDGALLDTDGAEWTSSCGGEAPPVRLVNIAGAGNGPAALVEVGSLTIGQDVEVDVRGEIPVIFAVYGDAVIAGKIDSQGPSRGSFGSGPPCAGQGADGDADADLGARGGGAGGFGTAGGAGGSFTKGGEVYARVAGGPAQPVGGVIPLRTGCPGGNGGVLDQGNGGKGGRAGGAVQFSVAGTLVISGRVDAAARAGEGGANGVSGGGGGGSGGAILLEATTLRLFSPGAPAFLNARGAGGGGGASEDANGAAGVDADDVGSAEPVSGGEGSEVSNVNRGGDAASQGALSEYGGPGVETYGAGGGGGGLGKIRILNRGSCEVGTAVSIPIAYCELPPADLVD